MTTIEDGPSGGKSFLLRRSPLFLRVVRSPEGEYDALDMVEDAPEPGETIYVYLRVGRATRLHVDGRDAAGKRFGKWYSCAKYRIFPAQPDDATARNDRPWQAWCWLRWKEIKQENDRAKERAAGDEGHPVPAPRVGEQQQGD